VRAAITVIVAIALAPIFVGIAAAIADSADESRTGLSLREQHDATVEVYVDCVNTPKGWIGTGVVVGPDAVLTAAHLINDCETTLTVHVGPDPEHYQRARPDLFSLDHDIMRLRVETPFDVKPATVVGVPRAGEFLCLSAARPAPGFSCGNVEKVEHAAGKAELLDHTIPTDHGNSGSGVYSIDGELVALAIQCYIGDLYDPELPCSTRGGVAVVVQEWMLP